MKKSILLVLLCSITLLANVGEITAFSGSVTITRDAQSITPILGSILEEKDKIATGEDGRLQIVFKDKTVISLGKNSTFDIEEYFFDSQKANETKASFGMSKGILKAITGQIGKINPSKFKLNTKSASIGIRGTNFFTEILPNGDLLVVATEGSVIVMTPFGEVTLTQGQFTLVRPNQPPTPPQEATPSQLEELQQNSGASENEQESGYDAGVLFISSEEETNTQNPDTPNEENGDSQELATTVLNDTATQNATDAIGSSQSLFVINVEAPGVNVNDFTDLQREFITNEYITSKLGSGWIANIKDEYGTAPAAGSLSLISGSDDGFDWGFWGAGTVDTINAISPEKVWIVGQNLVTDISSLSGTATYSGKVMGIDSGGYLINPTNSTINLNFDFGANTVDVSFPQINGSTGFGGITAGTYSTNGATYTIQDNQSPSNKLEGNFYDNFKTTAGTFEINNNKGVYKALKQ